MCRWCLTALPGDGILKFVRATNITQFHMYNIHTSYNPWCSLRNKLCVTKSKLDLWKHCLLSAMKYWLRKHDAHVLGIVVSSPSIRMNSDTSSFWSPTVARLIYYAIFTSEEQAARRATRIHARFCKELLADLQHYLA